MNTERSSERIANARAFDERRAAGKCCEQANRRLEPDLAERKETDETLRESDQRYRWIVDTASQGILRLDEKGFITLAEGRLGEMFGYETAAMLGTHYSEHLFQEDRPR